MNTNVEVTKGILGACGMVEEHDAIYNLINLMKEFPHGDGIDVSIGDTIQVYDIHTKSWSAEFVAKEDDMNLIKYLHSMHKTRVVIPINPE